ncbi:hypothetical protein PHLCEN_2v10889 [Hermanssonia centrifuga]|uniref:Uncharacterized protein n=1 Tax=Hermanssonia centrifuga TaxID=98765 RepID=A0A2R6NLG6_9APHY|nr:hypothetical protein PHLCEN_2v10889 [Hermanssonia centrifuga]
MLGVALDVERVSACVRSTDGERTYSNSAWGTQEKKERKFLLHSAAARACPSDFRAHAAFILNVTNFDVDRGDLKKDFKRSTQSIAPNNKTLPGRFPSIYGRNVGNTCGRRSRLENSEGKAD